MLIFKIEGKKERWKKQSLIKNTSVKKQYISYLQR